MHPFPTYQCLQKCVRNFIIIIIIIFIIIIIIIIIIFIIIIIIIIIVFIGIINIHYYDLEFNIVPHKAKAEKEKDCTTYDVEILCSTMEKQLGLIEPKYEQQVSRP